jgi:hypothetical protein
MIRWAAKLEGRRDRVSDDGRAFCVVIRSLASSSVLRYLCRLDLVEGWIQITSPLPRTLGSTERKAHARFVCQFLPSEVLELTWHRVLGWAAKARLTITDGEVVELYTFHPRRVAEWLEAHGLAT